MPDDVLIFFFSECECSKAGTIAGMNICNMITGQCMCKVDVTGRNCSNCICFQNVSVPRLELLLG